MSGLWFVFVFSLTRKSSTTYYYLLLRELWGGRGRFECCQFLPSCWRSRCTAPCLPRSALISPGPRTDSLSACRPAAPPPAPPWGLSSWWWCWCCWCWGRACQSCRAGRGCCPAPPSQLSSTLRSQAGRAPCRALAAPPSLWAGWGRRPGAARTQPGTQTPLPPPLSGRTVAGGPQSPPGWSGRPPAGPPGPLGGQGRGCPCTRPPGAGGTRRPSRWGGLTPRSPPWSGPSHSLRAGAGLEGGERGLL